MNLLLIIVLILILTRSKWVGEVKFLNERGKKAFGPTLWVILVVLVILAVLN